MIMMVVTALILSAVTVFVMVLKPKRIVQKIVLPLTVKVRVVLSLGFLMVGVMPQIIMQAATLTAVTAVHVPV